MKLVILLLMCGFLQTNTDGTVFLERGSRGFVPCPLVKSRQIPSETVVAMYWYYGSISRTSLLISHFKENVAPQNGIPEGVYDIDDEFSLVIENVTASNEGTYYFEVKPRLKIIEAGKVDVCDKVSSVLPYPTVIGCDKFSNDDADTCEVRVRHDSAVHNLTCVMKQVKPAVELRWIRLFWGGLMELNVSATVRHVVLPAFSGSSLRNNTYSTSASVQVPSVDDDAEYVCQAMGVAVGEGAHMIVRVNSKSHPTTTTYEYLQSSNNSGTTVDGVSPTTYNPAEINLPLIVLLVAIFILSIVSLIACVYIIHLRKEPNEHNRMSPHTHPDELFTLELDTNGYNGTSETRLHPPSKTTSSSKKETNRTWKRRHNAPAGTTEI